MAESGARDEENISVDMDALECLQFFPNVRRLILKPGEIQKQSLQYLCGQRIEALKIDYYPDLKPTDYYDQEYEFYLTLGEYIGGPEVEAYLSDLLEKFPPSLGKTKRKKLAEQAVREAFHLNKKYPMWAQEPEWPIGVNSPMEYISRKRDGELVQFQFRDVDTGEIRIVEQLY